MAAPNKIPAIPDLQRDKRCQEQIAALYVELHSPLSGSLRRWNLAAEDVEDIVQETFVRLLSRWPDHLSAEDTRFWIFRVAQNLAIDRMRAGMRSRVDVQLEFEQLLSTHPSPHFDPEETYLELEQWRLMQNNLTRLTRRQQDAIHMRIGGSSYKAIARQLNGTTNSVGELIRRALKRLGENGDGLISG